MITKNETQYTKDLPNKKLKVVREFNASIERVWAAWTESELLDQWWAPKPWKAKTKSMDFREGGFWLYSMVGPDGTRIYARIDYKTVTKLKNFFAEDSFCDENGNKNSELPEMKWQNEFRSTPNGSQVAVEITFKNEVDIQKIIDMGFQEGFAAAHDNLDELLAK